MKAHNISTEKVWNNDPLECRRVFVSYLDFERIDNSHLKAIKRKRFSKIVPLLRLRCERNIWEKTKTREKLILRKAYSKENKQ